MSIIIRPFSFRKNNLLFFFFILSTATFLDAQSSFDQTFTWPENMRSQAQQDLATRSGGKTSLKIPTPGKLVEFFINPNFFIKDANGASKRTYQAFSGRDSLDQPVFGYYLHDQIHLSYYQNGEVITISPIDQNPDRYKITSSNDLESMGEMLCAAKNIPGVKVRNGGSSIPCQTQGYSQMTFDLFVVCTGEWGKHFGSKTAALNGIIDNINTLNALYTAELNIFFNLITDDNFLYTSPSSDPFNPTGSTNRADQARNFFNDHVETSFDIGHVMHYKAYSGSGSSASGVAYLGSSCNENYKGGGWTGTSNPGYTTFNIKIMGHEIGHQLGADHDFYGAAGNCAGSQRSSGNGFEPGSGSTLMSYEKQCGSHNLDGPRSSVLYFNTHSVSQILNRINSQSCGSKSGSGNIIPVQIPGNFSIPKSTPFDLIATSSNNALSYIWEQYDTDNLGPNSTRCDPINGGQYTTTPMYRSYVPSSEGKHRSFPSKDVQKSGISQNGEVYATVARDITMRLMTRSGGNIRCDEMTVTVRDDPAFKILSPVMGDLIALSKAPTRASQMLTVLWETGDTENNGFSTVDIYYSIDGGLSFPYLLAENVPNDGEHEVLPPEIDTDQARLKIELTNGSGRMAIYNENRGDFTVGYSITPIEIAYFDGKIAGNHHNLSWILNNTGEHIKTVNMEYSYDGIYFTKVDIEGYELLNSENQWNSEFESFFTEGAKTYYRLVVTNTQNKTTYSHIVALKNEDKSAQFLQVQPNPISQSNLYVTFQKYLRSRALISVWSINGQQLYETRIGSKSKSLTIPFTYPTGLYILKVINGDDVYQRKVVVQNR